MDYRENDNLNISEIERYMQMDPKEREKLMAEMEAEVREKMKK